MSIQLSSSDYRQLTKVVQKLPDFTNVRDRRQLISLALEGTPKSEMMLARLDLDGAPMLVAASVIDFLAKSGQVAYGKEALGVFVNYIQLFVDDEDAEFIQTLFQKYPLDGSATTSSSLNKWLGSDSVAQTQEKIIGEDTLRHVSFLQQAVEASKAVVHIKLKESDGAVAFGTGFMVSPNHLMTNNHVINRQDQVCSAEYTFNYQIGDNSLLAETTTVSAPLDSFFYTNIDLDYTILTLENVPFEFFPLKLIKKNMTKNERVSIIQHPGGHLKKISIQNNFVAYADSKVVQYTTSTLPGSSGSPVFDDKFNVIAIHHSGGLILEPGTSYRYMRNAGTSISAVLADLATNEPNFLTQLKQAI